MDTQPQDTARRVLILVGDRLHLCAQYGDGPLLSAEGCQLDQSSRDHEVKGDAIPPDPAYCKVCWTRAAG